jgi:hypothetical protein
VTLEELENSLPNGFHDAEIERISVDYQRSLLVIELRFFVGDLVAPIDMREAYRPAVLTLSGVQFLAIDPPDARYPFSESGPLRIDACDATKNLDANLVKTLPTNSFSRSFFVAEWNAFIHIAASSAAIEWTAPVEYRKRKEHFLPGETVDL